MLAYNSTNVLWNMNIKLLLCQGLEQLSFWNMFNPNTVLELNITIFLLIPAQ